MVIYSMLQSMDNGRQNYRSLKLASALTFIGLIQVRVRVRVRVSGLGTHLHRAHTGH